MAQPYYDGHPLEEYLTESVGETPEQMPGSSPLFSLIQHVYSEPPVVFKYSAQVEKSCFIIFGVLESLSSLFTSDRVSKRTQAFAERFKYGIISSSLLSPGFTSTPAPHPHRRSVSPPFPGRLVGNHSRSNSLAESSATDQPSLTIPTEPETHVWPLTLSVTLAVAALSARFYSLFILLLVSTLYYMHVHRWDIHSKPDIITPSLEALQNLITAGKVWDAVVHDTIDTLESEERSIFYGPSSPMTPSSSLRVALSTSLLTTQNQCDTVRQLLSAIASPPELAQLSEMYAPPSPMKLTFCLNSNSDHHRPLSLPGSRQDANFTSVERKRSTWNGSYSALAQAGSPTSHIANRREKRRSDLSALLGAASPSRRSSVSAPTSPSPPKPLLDVVEEDDTHLGDVSSLPEGDDTFFGVAALDLRRKRRSQGMKKFVQNSAVPLFRSNSESRRLPTMSPASRYTSMQTTRHPLSISSLNQALQCALASKRYACSHLLALRFEEDEDEAYWEDVRSLMSLLTTTLIDASSRLTEVLDEVEEQHLKDEAALDTAFDAQPSSSLLSTPNFTHSLSHSISQTTSFAPLPSDLARFAAHVDAISSALNDARDYLEQCVASLKEEPSLSDSPCPSTSSIEELSNHPALLAYERLRRELGLALRECERGRDKLTNVLLPPPSSSPEDPEEDLPTLAPDMGSDDSDKPEETSSGVDAQNEDIVGLTVISPAGETFDADDASSHLLLTASPHHLPPHGIEQVFEAETGSSPAFSRERSRLTREERIKLAKTRRESGGDVPVSKIERWGPGGEVVQELKDVIWKVGERRRRMTEEQLRSAASSIPAPSHGAVTPMDIVQQSGVGS